MNRYTVPARSAHIIDHVVIALRKMGFSAWCDDGSIHTDASTASVLLAAGDGMFLSE